MVCGQKGGSALRPSAVSHIQSLDICPLSPQTKLTGIQDRPTTQWNWKQNEQYLGSPLSHFSEIYCRLVQWISREFQSTQRDFICRFEIFSAVELAQVCRLTDLAKIAQWSWWIWLKSLMIMMDRVGKTRSTLFLPKTVDLVLSTRSTVFFQGFRFWIGQDPEADIFGLKSEIKIVCLHVRYSQLGQK